MCELKLGRWFSLGKSFEVEEKKCVTQEKDRRRGLEASTGAIHHGQCHHRAPGHSATKHTK